MMVEDNGQKDIGMRSNKSSNCTKRDSEDLDSHAECSLAMAQATLQRAIDASGLNRRTIAMRFFRPMELRGLLESDSVRRRWSIKALDCLFSGDYNLTIRDMGRLLAICGFEPRFDLVPIDRPPGKPRRLRKWAGEI
jgi:hypothetical protein